MASGLLCRRENALTSRYSHKNDFEKTILFAAIRTQSSFKFIMFWDPIDTKLKQDPALRTEVPTIFRLPKAGFMENRIICAANMPNYKI
jgi:hypothetical protein